MKVLVFIFLTVFSLNSYSKLPKVDIFKLFDKGKVVKDAYDIVYQLGLNCATDPSLVEVFYSEFVRVLSGVARVASESAQLMAYKKDFPNLCHVLTQSHINTYREGTDVKKEKKCSLKNPLGGCLTHIYYTYEKPKPSYYWPKYLIEVTEKGNDPHHTFAEGNLLYSANRKISNQVEKFVDQDGAVKLTSLVMGGSNALNLVGMNVGKNDFGELVKVKAMSPLEKMRIRANKEKTNKSYDVSIWPVAMSELFARHFSVCGPVLERQGKDVGGYSWAFKGVPMTCPVATTNDAYAFWDTGMIDYLDPEALTAMAAGSNPLSCGVASGAAYLSDLGSSSGNSVGDKKEVNNQLGSLSKFMSQALSGCSYPILGPAHGIAKQALSYADPNKWKQQKCTLWGSVAPRMSTSVYETDYSYANTALKFKLLAHDLFSVPRGDEERWSLAYPWESGKSFLDGKFSNYFSKLQGLLKKKNIKLNSGKNNGRSYTLFTPGSPYLVDASMTPKHMKDQATNWSRELAYIASLTSASAVARREMERRLRDTHNQTLPLKEEIIWKKKKWCTWGGRKVSVSSDRQCFGQSHNHSHFIKYEEEVYKAGTRKVPEPRVKKWKRQCNRLKEPYRRGCKHPRERCVMKLVSDVKVPADRVNIPNEDPRSITDNSATRDILVNAATAAPWVAAEIARNRLSEMTGYNPIKGDRRIYTVFEKIQCVYPSTRTTTKIGIAPEVRKYDSCRSSVRYEVYKYIQTKLLRKICDAFGQTEGMPWK